MFYSLTCDLYMDTVRPKEYVNKQKSVKRNKTRLLVRKPTNFISTQYGNYYPKISVY